MEPNTWQRQLRTIQGQPSWPIASDTIQAYVTQKGGHLGPVTFDLGGQKVQPYSVAPWAEETIDRSLPPLLHALRGDFFCMPFGSNSTPYEGEKHPPHGETANAEWHFEEATRDGCQTALHLSLQTQTRPGRVDKTIRLVDGHSALYCEHVVSGMTGSMSFGHHPMLRFPDAPGSGRISTGPFIHGQVIPRPFELPEQRGYSMLKAGACFTSLEKVQTVTGEPTDVSSYPARRGYEDLVLMATDQDMPFAWTAVAFPSQGYVWFSLKDPRVLRQTILWISNGGRHYAPWNGRHVNVMGLEEVTSYFEAGLAESVGTNSLNEKGIATCLTLQREKPLVIRYIMAVASIPAGFDRVIDVEALSDGEAVKLRSASGISVTARVSPAWLNAD